MAAEPLKWRFEDELQRYKFFEKTTFFQKKSSDNEI
jgi:hypothetical protein